MTEPNNEENTVEVVDAGFGIKMDAKLAISDITDMVVSTAEEGLLLERKALEDKLKDASTAYSQEEDRLNAQSLVVAKKVKPDAETLALVKALGKFHKGDKKSRTYSADTDPEERSVVIEDEEVLVDVSIALPGITTGYGSTLAMFRKIIKTPFTTVMKGTVKSIEKKAKEVKQVQESLNEVRRKISDLPRMQRRAKAAVTRAFISGELTDKEGRLNGKHLLHVVDGVQPKALPSR